MKCVPVAGHNSFGCHGYFLIMSKFELRLHHYESIFLNENRSVYRVQMAVSHRIFFRKRRGNIWVFINYRWHRLVFFSTVHLRSENSLLYCEKWPRWKFFQHFKFDRWQFQTSVLSKNLFSIINERDDVQNGEYLLYLVKLKHRIRTKMLEKKRKKPTILCRDYSFKKWLSHIFDKF